METGFLDKGKKFLPFWLVKRIFLSKKKKHWFLFSAFFPASGNHYLNYGEVYFKLWRSLFMEKTLITKTLIKLLAIIFFDFSVVPSYQWNSLFELVEAAFLPS